MTGAQSHLQSRSTAARSSSETTCTWAGPYVLVIATALPDHGLAVEVHSTFVGHEGVPTCVTHLTLGPVGHDPVIFPVEHERASLDPSSRRASAPTSTSRSCSRRSTAWATRSGSTCPTTPSRSWSESSAERRVGRPPRFLPLAIRPVRSRALDPSDVRTLRVRLVGDRLRTGRGRRSKGSAMALDTTSSAFAGAPPTPASAHARRRRPCST